MPMSASPASPIAASSSSQALARTTAQTRQNTDHRCMQRGSGALDRQAARQGLRTRDIREIADPRHKLALVARKRPRGSGITSRALSAVLIRDGRKGYSFLSSNSASMTSSLPFFLPSPSGAGEPPGGGAAPPEALLAAS